LKLLSSYSAPTTAFSGPAEAAAAVARKGIDDFDSALKLVTEVTL